MLPCYRALHNHRMAHGLLHQLRPLHVFDSCGGSLASVMCLQAFGIDVIAESSESCSTAAKFMKQNIDAATIKHIFKDFEDQRCGQGECWLHAGRCSSLFFANPVIADFRIAGFPCHAFSSFRRWDGATGTRTSPDSMSHPSSLMMMESEDKCLRQFSSQIMRVCYENVKGIAKEDRPDLPPGHRSALQRFCTMLRSHGFEVTAVTLNTNYVQLASRSRVYILGMKPEVGGEEGLSKWVQRIRSIYHEYSLLTPMPIIDGVVPEEDILAHRELLLQRSEVV